MVKVGFSSSFVISGGRILDSSRNVDTVADLVVRDGRIAGVIGVDDVAIDPGWPVLVARGNLVCAGFVDLHVHFGEPGAEYKETIESGTRAAARGGFTTVCSMASTTPTIDNRGAVEHVLSLSRQSGVVRVLTYGSITRGRRGLELADLGDMADAGVVAFSDDGSIISSARMMRHALEYCRPLAKPVVAYCADRVAEDDGVMNEGFVASRLGLRGIPSAGEEAAIARDVALCDLTKGWLHVCHVSTAGGVEQIRRARERGIRVSADVSPHHLSLTEDWVAGVRWNGTALPFDTNARVAPPLRHEEDRQALLAGLRDGTITAIATDHTPQTSVEKRTDFDSAESGVIGLETALGVILRLVAKGEIPLELAIRRLTWDPALSFGLPHGTLAVGVPADIVIIDPNRQWVVDASEFASKSQNSPFISQTMYGRVVATIAAGQVVHVEPSDRETLGILRESA